MAAALLSPMRESPNNKMDFSYELNSFLERATDNLLLKDFKDCQKACMCGMARAKHFIEDDRAQSCMERLCVLCIQALAEMNQWQDVLPLIQDIYSSIELCPCSVIQLCILLHARVKEYSQCHALASLWLRCEDNSYKPGYDRVAALYSEHVMLPQGRFLLVPQFLDSCTHLSQDMKDKIMIQCEKVNTKKVDESKKTDLLEGDSTSKEISDTCDKSDNSDTDTDTSVTKYMKYFGCFLASKLAFPTYDVLWKIAVAVASLGLLSKLLLSDQIHKNKPNPMILVTVLKIYNAQQLKGNVTYPLRKLAVIWQNTLKFLKAIFTPYRPGR